MNCFKIRTLLWAIALIAAIVPAALAERDFRPPVGPPFPPPGDYNRDCVVDNADLDMVNEQLGNNAAPFTGADGNGNGEIDPDDRNLVLTNFGATAPFCNILTDAPLVNAGPNVTVFLSCPTVLQGATTDDGPLPPTYTWSQLLGPGTAVFSSANNATTEARFSALGTYLIQLAVFDGAIIGFDMLRVTVVEDPEPQPISTPSPSPKNYIRPNRSETYSLPLTLASPAQVRADVYTVQGEKVKTLFERDFPAGPYVVEWDGRNKDNDVVASDLYVVLVFENDRLVQKKKVVIQR